MISSFFITYTLLVFSKITTTDDKTSGEKAKLKTESNAFHMSHTNVPVRNPKHSAFDILYDKQKEVDLFAASQDDIKDMLVTNTRSDTTLIQGDGTDNMASQPEKESNRRLLPMVIELPRATTMYDEREKITKNTNFRHDIFKRIPCFPRSVTSINMKRYKSSSRTESSKEKVMLKIPEIKIPEPTRRHAWQSSKKGHTNTFQFKTPVLTIAEERPNKGFIRSYTQMAMGFRENELRKSSLGLLGSKQKTVHFQEPRRGLPQIEEIHDVTDSNVSATTTRVVSRALEEVMKVNTLISPTLATFGSTCLPDIEPSRDSVEYDSSSDFSSLDTIDNLLRIGEGEMIEELSENRDMSGRSTVFNENGNAVDIWLSREANNEQTSLTYDPKKVTGDEVFQLPPLIPRNENCNTEQSSDVIISNMEERENMEDAETEMCSEESSRRKSFPKEPSPPSTAHSPRRKKLRPLSYAGILKSHKNVDESDQPSTRESNSAPAPATVGLQTLGTGKYLPCTIKKKTLVVRINMYGERVDDTDEESTIGNEKEIDDETDCGAEMIPDESEKCVVLLNKTKHIVEIEGDNQHSMAMNITNDNSNNDDSTVQKDGDTFQKNGHAVQNDGNAVQNDGNAVQRYEDTIKKELDIVQKNGDAIQKDNDKYAVQQDADTVQKNGDTVQKGDYAVQKDRGTVQKGENPFPPDEGSVQKDGDAVQKDGDTVQKDRETVQKDRDTVQKDRDAVQKQGDTVQKYGNAVQKDRDAVQKHGDTVQQDRNVVQKDWIGNSNHNKDQVTCTDNLKQDPDSTSIDKDTMKPVESQKGPFMVIKTETLTSSQERMSNPDKKETKVISQSISSSSNKMATTTRNQRRMSNATKTKGAANNESSLSYPNKTGATTNETRLSNSNIAEAAATQRRLYHVNKTEAKSTNERLFHPNKTDGTATNQRLSYSNKMAATTQKGLSSTSKIEMSTTSQRRQSNNKTNEIPIKDKRRLSIPNKMEIVEQIYKKTVLPTNEKKRRESLVNTIHINKLSTDNHNERQENIKPKYEWVQRKIQKSKSFSEIVLSKQRKKSSQNSAEHAGVKIDKLNILADLKGDVKCIPHPINLNTEGKLGISSKFEKGQLKCVLEDCTVKHSGSISTKVDIRAVEEKHYGSISTKVDISAVEKKHSGSISTKVDISAAEKKHSGSISIIVNISPAEEKSNKTVDEQVPSVVVTSEGR